MLTVLIWFLTAVLFLDCVALILLVLVQLPKKEAGAGLAFGGGATDALFGAGSGNVLTKITKYAAIIFFAGTFILAVLSSYQMRHGTSGAIIEEKLKEQAAKVPASAASNPLGGNASSQEVPAADLPLTTTPAEIPAAVPVQSDAAPAVPEKP